VAIEWGETGKLDLLAEIPGRINRVGNVSQIRFADDHLPAATKETLQSGAIRLPFDSDEPPHSSRILTVLECHPGNSHVRAQKYDPRQLRERFLSLKEDTVALLEFLNEYGAWGDHFAFGRWFGESGLGKDEWKPRPAYLVPPHYFWHYRSSLRNRLEEATKNPARWFASTLDPPALQRIPDYPFHSYRIGFALEALEASVTFDLLKDVPMLLCAREDCRNPYFLSRPDKIFCSEKCARCVVTRRGRALKKAQQPKG
jgi:hypothetical protein